MSNNTNSVQHEKWLNEQVMSAVEKLESGGSSFVTNDEAKQIMLARKEAVKNDNP